MAEKKKCPDCGKQNPRSQPICEACGHTFKRRKKRKSTNDKGYMTADEIAAEKQRRLRELDTEDRGSEKFQLLYAFWLALKEDVWFMLAIIVVLSEFTAVIFRVYARSEEIYSDSQSMALVLGGFTFLILGLVATVVLEIILMYIAGKICNVDLRNIPTQTVSLVIFTRFGSIGLAALYASSQMDPREIPLWAILVVAALYALFWASLIELLAYFVSLMVWMNLGFGKAFLMTATINGIKIAAVVLLIIVFGAIT